jgi:hypothetical protein
VEIALAGFRRYLTLIAPALYAARQHLPSIDRTPWDQTSMNLDNGAPA